MKEIKTIDSVGQILCHDITQIIVGVKKDTVFRKGHVIQEEDIPVLLSVGKDFVYVWEENEKLVHENDAAQVLYKLCANENMTGSEVKEGKIDLFSEVDGLLKIDYKRMKAINSIGEIMIATRHGNTTVKKGDKLAGTRIIPLAIDKDKLKEAERIAGTQPILQIKKFEHKKVGIVTTGNEIFYERIKDTFTPVITKKLDEFDTEIIGHEIVNDDSAMITKAILKLIDQGADLIICTGGMSVDPDDRTPLAIKNTGSNIISYGSPILPGAMFLLAYYSDDITIMGLPGCVMYAKRTVFDLILPRVMANDPVTREELAALGHGGLCLDCPTCVFPICGFGKGV